MIGLGEIEINPNDYYDADDNEIDDDVEQDNGGNSGADDDDCSEDDIPLMLRTWSKRLLHLKN